MIFNEPISRSIVIKSFDRKLAEDREKFLECLALWLSVRPIFFENLDFKEVTIGDISMDYVLNVGLQLTEEGNFSSVESLVKALEVYCGREASITDASWATGKFIYFGSTLNRRTISVTLHGNSKCKLIKTGERTYTTDEFKVDCSEIQTIKEIPYVPGDNSLDPPVG